MNIVKKVSRFLTSSSLLLFPVLAFGQDFENNVVGPVEDIIRRLVPIVITLAVLYFFWGLAKYILNAGDDAKKAEGRNIMIWGVVALFVMVSVWGLVRLLGGTFNVDSENIPTDGTDLIPQ